MANANMAVRAVNRNQPISMVGFEFEAMREITEPLDAAQSYANTQHSAVNSISAIGFYTSYNQKNGCQRVRIMGNLTGT
jgi:hypothetical protein